ncbi:MAG TPA: hypothetical protein VFQ65_13370, partial [Kofleriaceae bacterium]|nr:hypothetical protein [Kofleriaceae bacterium]
MNPKAIITAALVIGTSTVALAQPAQGGVQVSDNDDSSFQVRDHREPMPAPAPYRPVYQPPVVVAPQLHVIANAKLTNGKDRIWMRTQPLSTIKLQAIKGRTNITEVAIKFANGRTQIIQENKMLTQSSCIDIDLNGHVRNVTGITI